MPQQGLSEVLAHLFAAHGWQVTRDAALEGRSGTVYGAPVLAEKDERILLIERRGPRETIGIDLVREMIRVVADTGADQGLLAHLGPVDGPARAAAAGHIILWDHDTTAFLMGETRLAQVADAELPELPLVPEERREDHVAEAVSDLLPAAFQVAPAPWSPDEPPSSAAADEPVFDLDGLEALSTLDALDFSALEAPLTPATPSEGDVLRIRVDLDMACQRARDRLFDAAPRTELVLQPVHVLDYECDQLVEGSLRTDMSQGRIQVHGTTKEVDEVDALWVDPALTGPLTAAVTDRVAHIDERPLRITPERAVEIAHATLLDRFSREVEIQTSDADEDFVITERRQVTPRPDQLRLRHLGVVQRPVWRLMGTNGAILVDAIDGHTVSEDLRNPNPDVAMLD